MSDMGIAAITAPRDERAVMVFESGVTVSLRLKKREELSVKRTVAKGKVETGYKISDGTVDDPKVITIEGIITGAMLPYAFGLLNATQNMVLAMNQAQQIEAAYDLKEFVSVYTSFNAMPQAVITSLSISREPKQNYLTVKLTAEKVDTVTFQRSRSIKSKSSNISSTAGKGRTSAGKKTAAPVDAAKEPQKVFALEKLKRAVGGLF
ncbi:phage baseplate protein [Enterobacter roggenkampii]|uniref:phage baseplate protein n=1 Tax=Enterobacter roggenkampii TaxID=1812935 RepID=UPI003BC1229E